MKLAIQKASTDVTVYVFIQNSSLTTGAGLTGLAYNTSSLVCYYVRPLAAAAQLSLATQTVTGAHSDGGFVEVDATNMPGWYRLDLSDAVCATGVPFVGVALKGAANMAPVNLEIQLTSVNLNDSVRGGMTALPNAAADAAGGLIISDAGGLDADAQRADVAAILVDTGTTLDGRIPAALVGGRMDANMGAISSDATAADNAESFFDGTGYAGTNNVIPTVTTVTNLHASAATAANQTTILSRIGTPTDLGGGASLSANLVDIESQTDDIGVAGAGLTSIPNSAGVTTLLSRVGTPSDLGGGASLAANLADIEAQTDDIGVAGAGLTAITGVLGTPAGASLAADVAAVKSDSAAILDDTGTSGVVVAAASKTGFRLSATGVDDVLDEVVLGSYTLRQLLRGIAAAGLGKLSGAATTTVTIRSADDTKDVVVATVDSDGNRSAITLDLT